jgi:hypothetical protein
MPRPKPLADLAPPAYPSLAEYRGSRRGFLGRLAAGGLAASLGGALLAACDAEMGGAQAGSYQEDPPPQPPPRREPPAPPAPPEQPRTPHPYEEEPWGGGARPTEIEYQVRLPAEGWAWASATSDEWGGEGWDVAFAVVFATYDAALAEHFEVSPDGGIEAIRQLLLDSSCGELESQPDWLSPALADALVKQYAAEADTPSEGITSATLAIDTCSEWFAAGDMQEPGY